ncbi:MAG: hypothetical protein HRT94_05745 [Alphaproteobacteria bacterium]|nr:hypothetical protein [Alphaproteobacteria bacterium]
MNIKLGLILGLSFVCVLLLWRIDHLGAENKVLSNNLETATETIKQHEENIKLTEEVSNEYQDSIASLNRELRRLHRIEARCVPIADKTGSNNGSTAEAEFRGGNGLSSEWLYDYAGRAEKTRLKLIGCQRFVNRTWDNLNN